MNWPKTIKITDNTVLGFDPFSMKIALVVDDNIEMWSRTFKDSSTYDRINDQCNMFYLGMCRVAGDSIKDPTVGYMIRKTHLLMELGFEQIVQPEYYSSDPDMKFQVKSNVVELVTLVSEFENKYESLTESIFYGNTATTNEKED